MNCRLFVCLLLLGMLVYVLSAKPKIKNGKIKNGVIRCNANYMYSKEDANFTEGEELGTCERYIWDVNDTVSGEFFLPRPIVDGWSLCVRAVPLAYTRNVFQLWWASNIRFMNFDIRMNYEFSKDTIWVTGGKFDGRKLLWRMTAFPIDLQPYPFEVDQEYNITIRATTDRMFEYYVNDELVGRRWIAASTHDVNRVVVYGSIKVLHVNTWCV